MLYKITIRLKSGHWETYLIQHMETNLRNERLYLTLKNREIKRIDNWVSFQIE